MITTTDWDNVKLQYDVPYPDHTARIIRRLLTEMKLGASMAVESADPTADAHAVRMIAAKIGIKVAIQVAPLENGSTGMRVWYMGLDTSPTRQVSGDMAAFIEQECQIEEGAQVPAGEIFKRYGYWCVESRVRQLSRNRFARELSWAGFPLNNQNTHRLGLRLKPSNENNSTN